MTMFFIINFFLVIYKIFSKTVPWKLLFMNNQDNKGLKLIDDFWYKSY